MFKTEAEKMEHLSGISHLVANHDGQLYPMLFCDFDGKHICFAVPFNDLEDKQRFIRLVQDAIVNKRISFFALVLESWITVVPNELQESMDVDEIMRIPADKRPHTHEVVLVTFSGPKEEVSYHAKINRDKDGKRSLADWVKQDGATTGRFANIWTNAIAVTN